MKFYVYTPALGESSILREDGVWISKHDANPLYQEFLAWCAEGNEPEEWSAE